MLSAGLGKSPRTAGASGVGPAPRCRARGRTRGPGPGEPKGKTRISRGTRLTLSCAACYSSQVLRVTFGAPVVVPVVKPEDR